jgi:hypothetical protein
MRTASRLVATFCLTIVTAALSGQELEPRAYSSAPTGFQFVVLAAGYSSGDLVFDPTLPIEDADASVSALALGWATTLNVLGRTSRLSVAVPFVDGKAQGLVNGLPAERLVTGIADTRVGFSWLFYGAPARTAVEFMKAERSPTVAGVSFTLGIPTGEYDEDRLINIGTNRFSLKSELGISHNLGKWTLEGAAAVSLFQDNDEWMVTSTRSQDPLYSVQAHIVRDFKRRLWLALDATYYWGGQAQVNGVDAGTDLSNSRIGATLSLPVGKTQSIKLNAASGVSTRTGTDFDSFGIAWQWAIPPKM